MNFWLNRKTQRQNINPLISESNYSNYVVWGSKTLQRQPIALDRVSVRRMMFYIEKQMRELNRHKLIGGHNYQWFERQIAEMLSDIRNRGGIHDYNLVADDQCVYIGTQFRVGGEWTFTELEVIKSE